MSLLGIDVGTTGCKASVFSEAGVTLSQAYQEYDFLRPQPGWAVLDSVSVWESTQTVIRSAIATTPADDPVSTLAVASMGEAMVPVTESREILGPSILNFDARGAEYIGSLPAFDDARSLYRINGNTLASTFGLTKLLWIRDNEPALYERASLFLNWGSFIAFMLGAEPTIDYSLANRSLLFDVGREDWSDELVAAAGIDRSKLPPTAPAGTPIGRVPSDVARRLGLDSGVAIVLGAHDQVANALGAGVVDTGQAMYGMGTYICAVPVFRGRREDAAMIAHGYNTEHHCVGDRFTTFLYQPGGALVKWYRDTFAALEHRAAVARGENIYDTLFAEMPEEPTRIVALPHFTPVGPPDFVSDACGLITGLYTTTSRGEILRGLVESATYAILENTRGLSEVDIPVSSFTAVGGGSASDRWVQLSADVLGLPFTRPAVTEAGALGAAILAGIGTGVFADHHQGIEAMVRVDRSFEPDPRRSETYRELYDRYTRLWPLVAEYQREIARLV